MLHTCLCLQLEAQSTSAFVPSVLYEFLHVPLCEPGRRVENKTFIAEAVVFVSLLSLWRKCFSVHSSLRCLHQTECVVFSLHLSVEGIFSVAVWLLVFYTVVRCKRRGRDVKCDILTAYRPWREVIYPGGLWLISFWVNVLKCVSVAVCVKWKIIDIVFSTYVKHNLE